MPNEDPHQVSLLEGLHSTPARRYLAPDPIPDEVLWAILDAAIRGPSAGNAQSWGWVVVADPTIKSQIASWYREGWQRFYGFRRADVMNAEPASGGSDKRSYLAAEHLAEHLEEAPVWVIPVLRKGRDSTNPRLGSSIYGAVQQLCLAARAHGVGATLTTLYQVREDEVRELLGLPDDALTMGLIPLGYPSRGNWSQPRRRPVEEVVHWGSWGRTRVRPQ
jgi:nitroreductase